MNRKVKCSEYRCSWQGTERETLTAPNPFDLVPQGVIEGCPECKEINTIVKVCDEPDCWEPVSCGTPTEDGYRSTCGKHRPKE